MCRWTTVKLGLEIVALWTILCPKRKGKEEVTRTWKELVSYRKLLWGEQWSLIGDIGSLNYLSRREPGGCIPWSPSLFLSNFMLEHFIWNQPEARSMGALWWSSYRFHGTENWEEKGGKWIWMGKWKISGTFHPFVFCQPPLLMFIWVKNACSQDRKMHKFPSTLYYPCVTSVL